MVLRTTVLGLLALGAGLPAASPVETPDPAGTLLVVSQVEDSLSVVDLETGDVRARLAVGRKPHEIAVSPDGRLAVVGLFGKKRTPESALAVVDVEGGVVHRTIDLGEHRHPQGLEWTPDGRIVAVSYGTGHVVLADPGGSVRAIATGHDQGDEVAVTPDGRYAFVTHLSADAVTMIDLVEGAKIAEWPVESGPEGVAVTRDGKEVWVTNRAADRITVIDVGRREVAAVLTCAGFPVRVAAMPDGKRMVVSCSRSHEVVLFDVGERREIVRSKIDLTEAAPWNALPGERPFGAMPVPIALAVSTNGDAVFVAADLADVVIELDATTLEVRRLHLAGTKPDGIGYSAREKRAPDRARGPSALRRAPPSPARPARGSPAARSSSRPLDTAIPLSHDSPTTSGSSDPTRRVALPAAPIPPSFGTPDGRGARSVPEKGQQP